MSLIHNDQPWILHRADPYVLRADDGWFYFLATVPAYDQICIRRAATLGGLPDAPETVLWRQHDSGPMSCHIWAPEMHRLNGQWYIYFAAGEREDPWRIRPYALVCKGADPMTDPWQECGMLQAAAVDPFSFTDFSLDATVFSVHDRQYIVWAEKVSVGRKISNLYIAEMETPTRLKTAQVLLSTPDYAWERQGFWVNEGPALLRHGDRLLLTFSASETSTAYCVGMLSAHADADLLDPASWTKHRNPVLATDSTHSVYGPGHNCFTRDEQGRDVIVYHARSYKDIVGDPLDDPNRHARLRVITWSSDGWPQFS